VWTDSSGNENNVPVSKGTVQKDSEARGGNNIDFIYGTTTDGIRFVNQSIGSSSDYTLFHITRYNGATRQRIWDSISVNGGVNWLSGHHGGYTGGCYHYGGWVLNDLSIDHDKNDWVRCALPTPPPPSGNRPPFGPAAAPC
jgi:hypothetical protein